MKNYLSIAALLLLAFVALGCSLVESEAKKIYKTGSPQYAYEQYLKAIEAKDTERMKSLMSKDSIKLLEKLAKERNMTTDEFLKAFQKARNFETKLRNEKIKSDTATLEEQHENKYWYVVVLVKENGWKYAADKTQEERSKKLLEDK